MLSLRSARIVTVGVDVAITSRIALDVRLRGGDLIETVNSPDGSTCLLLADVSSKAAADAADVELLRRAFVDAVHAGRNPADIMAGLNRVRFGALPRARAETFAVALIVRLSARNRSLCYASAGHDAALVVRAATHRHLAPTGPVIGVMSDAEFANGFVDFAADDLFLAATDGFTECRRDSAPFSQFGTAGIVRALRGMTRHSPHAACAVVGAAADEFSGRVYRDDASMVAMARTAW